MTTSTLGAAVLLASLLPACQPAFNYEDPDGPRFSGGAASRPSPPPEPELRVVTFNIRYAEDVDGAVAELRAARLLDADVVTLQEMDAEGTATVAGALGMSFVYYPASIHGERDFGNAILSRWPILDDRKVLLPGRAPFDQRARIAVAALLDGPCGPFFVISVHDETALAGEDYQRRQILAILDDAIAPFGSLPGIVAGDFNVVSGSLWSWTEACFVRRGLPHAAPPPGAITATSPFGELALDHIFVRGFEPRAAEVVRSAGASDHHAVTVLLRPACD